MATGSKKKLKVAKLVVIGEVQTCIPCTLQFGVIEEDFAPKHPEVEIEHVEFHEEKRRCLGMLECDDEDEVCVPVTFALGSQDDEDVVCRLDGLHSLRQIENAFGWTAAPAARKPAKKPVKTPARAVPKKPAEKRRRA